MRHLKVPFRAKNKQPKRRFCLFLKDSYKAIEFVSKNQHGGNVTFTFLIGMALFVTLFMFWRCFYGAEITDEMLPLGEAWLVLNGATPYVDEWFTSSGFSIFWAPFLAFYLFINGSTEGIFLFARLVSFVIRTLTAMGFAFVLKRIGYDTCHCFTVYIVMATFLYAVIIIYSYITISVTLLLVCGIYLCWLFQKSFYQRCHLPIIGSLFAFCIYAQPSSIMAAIIMIGIFAIAVRRQRQLTSIFYIIEGGVGTAVVITIWMLIQGRGIHNLLYGLNSVINFNPYFKLPHSTIVEALHTFLSASWWMLCVLFFLIILHNALYYFANVNWNWACRAFFLLLTFTIILFFRKGVNTLYELGCCINVYLIWQTPRWLKEDKMRSLFFIWVPLLIMIWFLGGASGGGNILSRVQLLCALAFIPLLDIDSWIISKRNKRILLTFMSLLCVGILIKANYTYVYRDQPIDQLTYQVPSGVYRGIYTTEERANTLVQLETYLDGKLSQSDSVLFMETVPCAYLMTDAKPCTPSTWDISLYSYGFNNDSLYQRYFFISNDTPDYIIYVDTGRDEKLSIERQDYRFTRYVKQNYIENERLFAGSWQVITYRQK